MIGIGLDLCRVERMKRILDRNPAFLQRYFTLDEQAYIKAKGQTAPQTMAALYAAKEALLKAMGIGIGRGVDLKEIEVIHQPEGQPCYRLTDGAAEKMAALGAARAWLSLSHEDGMAAAVAVLE